MLHVSFDSGTNSSKKKKADGDLDTARTDTTASMLHLQGAAAGRPVRTALLSRAPRRLQHEGGSPKDKANSNPVTLTVSTVSRKMFLTCERSQEGKKFKRGRWRFLFMETFKYFKGISSQQRPAQSRPFYRASTGTSHGK